MQRKCVLRALSGVFGLLGSEGDGTRTRNHRIDSLMLSRFKSKYTKWLRLQHMFGCTLVAQTCATLGHLGTFQERERRRAGGRDEPLDRQEVQGQPRRESALEPRQPVTASLCRKPFLFEYHNLPTTELGESSDGARGLLQHSKLLARTVHVAAPGSQ